VESWFVAFVNKSYRLYVSMFVSGVLGCILCIFPFNASYYLPLIFAIVVCLLFFLAS
jgi:uncharacterized membrane protein HdeD (DUF308 family)